MILDLSVYVAVQTYVNAVDTELPGLIQGLYLVGSVALHDFHPGASDIDFVAVSSAPPDDRELRILERVHAHVADAYPRPYFDGSYVTWDQLAADPLQAAPGPHVHKRKFSRASRGGRHPVTWHTLADHGFALRGPLPGDMTVHTDRSNLTTWTHGNLADYWRPWWRRASRLPSPLGLACLGSWGPAWGVLGVSRLHYTLTTGRITSKRGAGEYALTRFDDQWHRIVEECLRVRCGAAEKSLYRTPFERRSQALAFIDMAISDAQQNAHDS
ncbi:aminoglycoside adenylyltransferase domain-containing protein [Streptomyces sp. NPDC020489]|uniref:aminoglycoside adenylyltransferase domain-containing protein n=1 Tax=Streptomyces sp. NPDC020489 TaxID=3365077 RepID=UPI0037A11766